MFVTRKNAPLLAACGLLAAACLLLYLPQRFSRSLVSTAEVPLRRPLAAFPEQLGPYVKVGEEHLTADVERTLGTQNYIVWTYRDTRVGPGGGPNAIRFQFAYWSGTKQILSTGVHYPELCYAGSGVNAVKAQTETLTLPGEVQIPLRLFQFAPPGKTEPCTVGYFFILNGRFLASADLLRFATFFGPTRDLYYCKLEMMPGMLRGDAAAGPADFAAGVAEPAAAQQRIHDFLLHAFPEAKKSLP
jgi:hypothetical protein